MRLLARLLDRLDFAGMAGSLFAAACCLGFAPLLAIVASLGLGFLINDAVLLSLLVVFLGVALAGLRGDGPPACLDGVEHRRSPAL